MANFNSPENQVRCAAIRATVTALLSASPGVTMQDMWNSCSPDLPAGTLRKTFESTIWRMVAKERIIKQRVGHNTYQYFLPTNGAAPQAEKPAPKAVRTPRAVPSVPAIQIDVIKATGRIRITTQGLVIEVGVVP